MRIAAEGTTSVRGTEAAEGRLELIRRPALGVRAFRGAGPIQRREIPIDRPVSRLKELGEPRVVIVVGSQRAAHELRGATVARSHGEGNISRSRRTRHRNRGVVGPRLSLALGKSKTSRGVLRDDRVFEELPRYVVAVIRYQRWAACHPCRRCRPSKPAPRRILGVVPARIPASLRNGIQHRFERVELRIQDVDAHSAVERTARTKRILGYSHRHRLPGWNPGVLTSLLTTIRIRPLMAVPQLLVPLFGAWMTG